MPPTVTPIQKLRLLADVRLVCARLQLHHSEGGRRGRAGLPRADDGRRWPGAPRPGRL